MVWALFLLLSGQFDTTFREGLVALNQNNLAVAETKLEAASAIEPKNPRVWLAIAQTRWKLHKDAAAAARHAESFAAGDAVVLRGLALFYSESGDAHSAARVLQASAPDEAFVFELVESNLKRENFAGALEILHAARDRFPASAQLTLAAGVTYYGLRRFPEAIDAFLRTAELDPAAEQSYIFLGRILDQAEDRLPRITARLAQFQKRAPESYLSNFLLGKALGDEALLRKSIALNDGYWESHFELGVLLAGEHKHEDAARELRRAADLNPADAAAHYHLARVYDRLGKTAEAAAERQIHTRLTASAPGMGAGVK